MNIVEDKSFWARVVRTNECWIWQGSLDRDGYGKLQRNNRIVAAHRYAITAPYKTVVCHTCDTPACVNPKHLVIADNAFNSRDMVLKRRVFTKYSEAQIVEVRRLLKDGQLSQREIGRITEVHFCTVNAISTKRNWKHT